MHVKRIHDMVEKLTKCAEMEFEKGIENVDTKEMGEVVDIIKDLCEAEYYAKISKAMDEAEYGEEYDEYGPMEDGRRGYRGQPRSKTSGRYMSRGDGRRSNRGRRGYDEPMGDYEMTPEMYRMYSPEYLRDIDRMDGKMYYSGGSSSGGNSSSGMSSQGGSMGGQQTSRTENARRGYVEAKEMHKGNSAEDKETKRKELDKWMTEFSSDVKQMVGEMSPEEKTVLKAKLNSLHSSI